MCRNELGEFYRWWIFNRGREGSRLPALRTVQAVLPHTALQSVVASSRLARQRMGPVHHEEPLCSEEGDFFIACLDAVVQRRQHPLGPPRGFHPAPLYG